MPSELFDLVNAASRSSRGGGAATNAKQSSGKLDELLGVRTSQRLKQLLINVLLDDETSEGRARKRYIYCHHACLHLTAVVLHALRKMLPVGNTRGPPQPASQLGGKPPASASLRTHSHTHTHARSHAHSHSHTYTLTHKAHKAHKAHTPHLMSLTQTLVSGAPWRRLVRTGFSSRLQPLRKSRRRPAACFGPSWYGIFC